MAGNCKIIIIILTIEINVKIVNSKPSTAIINFIEPKDSGEVSGKYEISYGAFDGVWILPRRHRLSDRAAPGGNQNTVAGQASVQE